MLYLIAANMKEVEVKARVKDSKKLLARIQELGVENSDRVTEGYDIIMRKKEA